VTLQASQPAAVAPVTDGVTVIIDGFEITVPKGTLVIRAAELLGLQIPRFCDHPLLEPVGACRQPSEELLATREVRACHLEGSRRRRLTGPPRVDVRRRQACRFEDRLRHRPAETRPHARRS